MKNIYPLYLIIVTALLTACNNSNTAQEPQDTPLILTPEFKETLALEKVITAPVSRTITLTGIVDFNKDKTVPYVSLIDGIINKTFFSLGDYVQKGQLLAEINSVDLNELRNDLKEVQTELNVAKRELTSTKEMYADGIASQKELLEAESAVEVLQTKVISFQNNLKMYNVDNDKGTFQIKAPITGYIVTKDITDGSSVTAGDEALFTIADLNDVWVIANVYATNMRYIKTGLNVMVNTLAYPEEYFPGQIKQVSQTFDNEERVLKAKIVMKNDEMKLRPGMSADIIITLIDQQNVALAIPNNAIIFDNNQNYVVIYHPDNTIEVRKITPIAKNVFQNFVTEGLKEGDMVVTENELLLYEQLTNHI